MRGEVWTVSASGYASKPRPAVVIQSDEIQGLESTILCLVTSRKNDGVNTRVEVRPSRENGLEKTSYIMTDKIVSVRKSSLGERMGKLEDAYIAQMDESLKEVLFRPAAAQAEDGAEN